MSHDIQMQPMPSYGHGDDGLFRGPQRMASQESVTSEGSMYLEPARTSQLSQLSQGNRSSLPGEHDSGVVDVDGFQPDFRSDSTLPTTSSRSSLPSSNTPSPQKSSLPYPYQGQGQGHLQGHSPQYPPKMMKRPDSLAAKGHEYEELPHSRYTNPSRPYYNESAPGISDAGRPPLPPLAKLVSLNNNSGSRGSLENLCEEPVVVEKPATTHRRRQNPLYDSADHDEEQDYKSKRRKSEQCQCPCFVQLIIAIIAVVALLLAILSLIGATEDDEPKTAMVVQPPPNTSSLEAALQRMQELETKYETLLQKFTDLQNKQSQDLEAIQADLTAHDAQFEEDDEVMQQLQTSFTTGLSNLNTSLLNKVSEISKMEGPQGPAGVGNLTACQRLSKSLSTALGAPTTTTSWIPESQEDADKSVIMGIECTTLGGTVSRLETQTNNAWTSGNNWQYRCVCAGTDNTVSTNSRKCELVYWKCPRLS